MADTPAGIFDLDEPASAEAISHHRRLWGFDQSQLGRALGWFGKSATRNVAYIEAGKQELMGASLRLFNVYRFTDIRPSDWGRS